MFGPLSAKMWGSGAGEDEAQGRYEKKQEKEPGS